MKNPALLLITSLLIFTSCITDEGPVGPAGPVGPEGPQGPAGPVGQGFEVVASFSEANGYSEIFAFPNNAEVLSTDIVMAYLLWDTDPDDIWQALPVSVFFSDGELQYGFDHTLADVKLFLTGDTDLSTVGPEYTQDQIFRIAILPVDYLQSNPVDINSMEEVMSAIGAENLERINLGAH